MQRRTYEDDDDDDDGELSRDFQIKERDRDD
jgi:hypothetical protein